MQVALHMDIALAAPINLLPLPRRAAGHIDQRHLIARVCRADAAEGRLRELVGQEIGLVRRGEAFLEDLERGDAFGLQAGGVHAGTVIGALGIEPVELAAQLGELQAFELGAAEAGDIGQQRGCCEGGSKGHHYSPSPAKRETEGPG